MDKNMRTEIMHEATQGLLISAVTVGICLVSKKAGIKTLPLSNVTDVLRLTAAITGSSMIIKELHTRGILPASPFKEALGGRKDMQMYADDALDAVLMSLGVAAVCFMTRKAFGKQLVPVQTLREVAVLSVLVVVSSAIVETGQKYMAKRKKE